MPGVRCSLFNLSPDGVYLAGLVTQSAGELLPHRFTLTLDKINLAKAVYFLLHFPGPRGRWALPITVFSGARTFLPPDPQRADKATQQNPTGDRPAHSIRWYSSRLSVGV